MIKKVVIDSDAIYAIYNHNDPLHSKAIKTLQLLNKTQVQLIYPTSVIFEVMSLFQRVLSAPSVTIKMVDLISRDLLIIYAIDNELLKEATNIFKPAGSEQAPSFGSKKNTLVDCSVVAVAKKIKADGVFSYDEFYKKQGLKLAEDLI
ncbi:PIN domain-containing protein [Candidatus Daviesbacteria bacterium]|nr:PIN domain-containing protein [Candidatus Daviesbacteria bacterium]